MAERPTVTSQSDAELIASMRKWITGLDMHGYNRSLIEENAMLLCDRLEGALALLQLVHDLSAPTTPDAESVRAGEIRKAQQP